MKKLTVCILLSIIMCFSMAFPASAMTYYTDKVGFYDAIQKVLSEYKNVYPAGYNYILFSNNVKQTELIGTANVNLAFWVSKTPTIGVGSKIYQGRIMGNGVDGVTIDYKCGNPNPLDNNLTSYIIESVVMPEANRIYFTWNWNGGIGNEFGKIYPYYSNASLVDYTAIYNTCKSYGYDMEAEYYANVSSLLALINQAKSKQNTGYTGISWNALQSKIAAAESLIALSSKTQSQVDTAKNNLQAALDGLTLLPDTSALLALLNQAKAVTSDGYNSATWQALQSAITSSQNLLNGTDYTALQVGNERIKLQSALNGLVYIADLQSILTTAKAKQNTGYTGVSWKALQTAITAADNLLATTGYTQTQVDEAKNNLQTALDGLTLLPDTSALLALLNQAKAVTNDGYNSVTWQVLQSAITSAQTLLNGTDYTSAQVESARSNLQSALNGLEYLPSVDELKELLVEADAIEDIGYTAPTWTRFDNARADGHALVARTNYTAYQVQSTTTELRVSMDNLTALPDASFLRDLLEVAHAIGEDINPEVIEAINNAQALLNSFNYTMSELMDAYTKLLNAINKIIGEPDPPEPDVPVIIVEGATMYGLNGEQIKYTDLINGVQGKHLEPVKQAIEENIDVARSGGFLVWLLILAPLIIVIVVRSFLNNIGSNIRLDMTPRGSGDVHLTGWKRRHNDDNIFG